MNQKYQDLMNGSATDESCRVSQPTLDESVTNEQEASMANDQNLDKVEATTQQTDGLCQADQVKSTDSPSGMQDIEAFIQAARGGLLEQIFANAEAQNAIRGDDSSKTILIDAATMVAKIAGLPVTPDIVQGLMTSDFMSLCESIRTEKDRVAFGKLLKAAALARLAPASYRDKGDTSTPFRNLYGCETKGKLYRLSEHYFGMPESTLRQQMLVGTALARYLSLLLNGAEGEPGLTLEQIAQNLTKLPLFEQVARIRGVAFALRAFRELPFRKYQAITKSNGTKKSSPARDRSTSSASNYYDLDLEKLPENLREPSKVLYRIIVTGGTPHTLESRFPEALKGIEDAIAERAQQIDAATNARLPRIGDFPATAEDQVAYAMSLYNPFEIIDLVKRVNQEAGPTKRFVSICLARLFYEDIFAPYWRTRYSSFYEFARIELGIDSECRDMLRIGRNIAKYPWILQSLSGIDTDTVFLNLRHLDRAMLNHAGKNSLIRSKLITLSTREFALFAQNAEYESKLLEKPLSSKQKELFVSFLGRINMNPGAHENIHFIEVFSDAEWSFALQYVQDAEARLLKLSEVAPSTPRSPESEDQPLAA